jgi:hypothetical protein
VAVAFRLSRQQLLADLTAKVDRRRTTPFGEELVGIPLYVTALDVSQLERFELRHDPSLENVSVPGTRFASP